MGVFTPKQLPSNVEIKGLRKDIQSLSKRLDRLISKSTATIALQEIAAMKRLHETSIRDLCFSNNTFFWLYRNEIKDIGGLLRRFRYCIENPKDPTNPEWLQDLQELQQEVYAKIYSLGLRFVGDTDADIRAFMESR